MELSSTKTVCFSPTGTTRAVVLGIARGFGSPAGELVDITSPNARRKPLRTSHDELLIVAVPVYMGRVPALLSEWLQALEADQTPTVCVVVYGNRAYENALLELRDIVASRGCVPVAGAAFIGEHSFSIGGIPVARGRPDDDDLAQARGLGRTIREKLRSAPVVSQLVDLQVPGSRPYGGITELWDVDFIAVDDRCTQCGNCAEACPVGAVDSWDSALIDNRKCVTCCACVKGCPQGARSVKPGPVREAQKRLVTLYSEPRRPECFI